MAQSPKLTKRFIAVIFITINTIAISKTANLEYIQNENFVDFENSVIRKSISSSTVVFLECYEVKPNFSSSSLPSNEFLAGTIVFQHDAALISMKISVSSKRSLDKKIGDS